jgi:hypothetical protein
MEPKPGLSNARLKARLYIVSLAILALGLFVGILIYALADEAVPEAGSYIIVDGMKYPIAPNQSKRYIRDLERFGGKASVLFDEFDRWLADRWQGKNLGVTIAFLATLVSLGLFLFAASLPPDPE